MLVYQTKNILGVRVADVTLETIGSIIQSFIKLGGKRTIFGANSHNINLYQTNKKFRKAMDNASFIYPEGVGTVIASRLLGHSLRGKTTLLDFIFGILEYTQAQEWPLFILGGTKEVSEKARENLKVRFPKLIIDIHDGYFSKKETRKVIDEINKKKPKIVFVAMGSPMQEIWIEEHKQEIDSGVFLGIGGSIDVIAGRVPRAPLWMRRVGCEWLYRMCKEPGRLWRRYTIGNMVFLSRVFVTVCRKLWTTCL